MTLSEVMDYMLKIQQAGHQLGLTDDQIGQLEIFQVKEGRQVETNFSLEMAQIKRKHTFILLEIRPISKIMMIPGVKSLKGPRGNG